MLLKVIYETLAKVSDEILLLAASANQSVEVFFDCKVLILAPGAGLTFLL